MADIATINGNLYTDDDFSAVNYANRFQQLVGDIYEHVASRFSAVGTGSLSIGTGSKALSVVSTSSGDLSYSEGQWVFLHPQASSGVTPAFVKNYMLGCVTAVDDDSITVNVVIAHGSGTYNSFYISHAGQIITTLASPMLVTNGGTGQTTIDGAATALGVGGPATRCVSLEEDFTGYFKFESNGYVWTGEKLLVTALADPEVVYNASTNPVTGGEFLLNPQSIYIGDDFVVNTPPNARTDDTQNGGNGVQATAPSPTRTDWSSRPGVVGFTAIPAGSRLTMLRKFTTPAAGGDIQFPFNDDVLEFSFMIPPGEGFTQENNAGFSIGFTWFGASYSLVVNVGHGGALPFSNPLSPLGDLPPPTLLGKFGGMSVIAYDSPGDPEPVVYVDTLAQTNVFSPREGEWYKVRLTKTDCKIYQNGVVLVKTISGWTAPVTPNVSFPSIFWCGFNKTAGSGRTTVLLDYVYHRHALTPR